MKTSVLIPCIPEHFVYLERVIEAYQAGTKTPDEIVIVLSDCLKVPDLYIDVFNAVYSHAQKQEIKVRFIPVLELLYTGEACEVGECSCSGDIVMVQAADDLPHPRRVEIVEHFFEKYDIVSLNHSFVGSTQQGYKPSEKPVGPAKVVQPHTLYNYHEEKPDEPYGKISGFPVAAGTICYRRDIVGKFEWSNARRGQDNITCKRILKQFKKSICIDAPIYYYLIRD